MTETEASILFFAEYIIAAAILLFLRRRNHVFDIRRFLSRSGLVWHIGFAMAVIITEVLMMSLVFILPLSLMTKITASGIIHISLSSLAYIALGSAWIRRCRTYPRGEYLSAVMILLYMTADIFMPSYAKYMVSLICTGVAWCMPNRPFAETR